MLSSKVADINFFDRDGTLYNYLDHFLRSGVDEKNNLFLKTLSKRFALKSAFFSKGDIINIEKAYNDLVLNNKTIVDVFYKKTNNKLTEKDKNIFQEAKNLFNLQLKIYKKLILEREILKPEETIAERVKL